MTLTQLKKLLLTFPGTTEDYPWGPSPKVLKVGGKMFAIVGIESEPLTISLKANPEDAIIQRGMYPAVQPGYHLNKDHWNTVTLDGSIPGELIRQMIEESYRLVAGKLARKIKKGIGLS